MPTLSRSSAGTSSGAPDIGLRRVARVKAGSLTNKQPEACAIAGPVAKSSFAETENGRHLRTENDLTPRCLGRRRPSQRGPNPRQYSRSKAKRKGDRASLSPVFGGDEEDRTPDLGIANAALSQLSYVPTIMWMIPPLWSIPNRQPRQLPDERPRRCGKRNTRLGHQAP